MKKVALVFVLAVLVPSIVLAWLAVRSLRDQQFLLERQQSLLYQGATDVLAQGISDHLARQQQDFGTLVERLVATNSPAAVAAQFDSQLRQSWPLAEVGFCVTLAGKILSPSPTARAETKSFYSDNGGFLGNREAVEVYNNLTLNVPSVNSYDTASRSGGNSSRLTRNSYGGQSQSSQPQVFSAANQVSAVLDKQSEADSIAGKSQIASPQASGQNFANYKTAQQRKVIPQQQNIYVQSSEVARDVVDEQNLSRVVPAEGEFRQLVGEGRDGMFARFLQNKLKLMVWHRLQRDPDYIFGAQLDLNRIVENLRPLVQPEPALMNELCIALLDENARPVVLSRPNFQANWKRPFVATEIGDALPHWEIAAYLVNPAQLTQAARTASLTLGLLVAVLLFAIGVGSWLIVRSLGAELKLARQKTDFVSNVSHELKTPLTSIHMFSELLAEGRVTEPAKQKSYLNIITAEAARLTRLINNVLDFSRLESGEKKYNFQACDLTGVARNAVETFRPHLEANGFTFDCALTDNVVSVRGDADALSQIIVNLLSNAEKYSNGGKEITLELAQRQSPVPYVEIKVLDRGLGVPRDCAEKIFEKFYRAHDSLSSGIQGSGLGLTIARQIARAHGGDVVYEPRAGGGSCFSLRIPIRGETA